MLEIPLPLFRQIGSAATYRSHADQWSEHGWVCVDGVVHEYWIDRKEQADGLRGSWPIAAFCAQKLPADVLAWAEALVR